MGLELCMTYATGHPVSAIGGRLALDFTNTADWSTGNAVTHEKIQTPADLDVWMRALGVADFAPPASVAEVHSLRAAIRSALLDSLKSSGLQALPTFPMATAWNGSTPLAQVLAASAVSILADSRERARLRICEGADCGWLFIDESRAGRRRWCSMADCGNRAKAKRHYQKKKDKAR